MAGVKLCQAESRKAQAASPASDSPKEVLSASWTRQGGPPARLPDVKALTCRTGLQQMSMFNVPHPDSHTCIASSHLLLCFIFCYLAEQSAPSFFSVQSFLAQALPGLSHSDLTSSTALCGYKDLLRERLRLLRPLGYLYDFPQ